MNDDELIKLLKSVDTCPECKMCLIAKTPYSKECRNGTGSFLHIKIFYTSHSSEPESSDFFIIRNIFMNNKPDYFFDLDRNLNILLTSGKETSFSYNKDIVNFILKKSSNELLPWIEKVLLLK